MYYYYIYARAIVIITYYVVCVLCYCCSRTVFFRFGFFSLLFYNTRLYSPRPQTSSSARRNHSDSRRLPTVYVAYTRHVFTEIIVTTIIIKCKTTTATVEKSCDVTVARLNGPGTKR